MMWLDVNNGPVSYPSLKEKPPDNDLSDGYWNQRVKCEKKPKVVTFHYPLFFPALRVMSVEGECEKVISL